MKALGPSDDNETRKIVLKLLARLRCSECGTPFELHDFVLQHHAQDTWVLAVECRHCGESTHVVVSMQHEVRSEGANELASDDIKTTTGRPPVSADDVLDMHEFLEEFDGDFLSLIDV